VRNLLGTLFALVVADGVITEYLVMQGMARELNPFVSILLGQTNFLIIKVLGALLCVLAFWYVYKRRPKITSPVVVGCVAAYTGIVYWNVITYFIFLI
jgi:hypothetical protein